MKKRVRMVVGWPLGNLGGAQRVVEYIERSVLGGDCDVEWFSSTELKNVPRSRRYPGLNLALSSFAATRALRQLPRADLTISHGMFGWGTAGRRVHVYHGTVAGLATACRSGVPKLDYLVSRRFSGELERWCGLGAVRVGVSERVRRDLAEFYRLRCDQVVHNAVDTDHFTPGGRQGVRERLGLPQDRFLVLLVGRMDYGKGREVLREVAARTPADVHFVLAAPEVAKRETLPADRIHVLPGVEYGDLPDLYGACDALLCASLYEGFGLTLIEAWASGIPVVTGRVGLVSELEGREPSFDACVTEVGDAAGMARIIQRLTGEGEMRERQAAWGRAMVEQRFSLEQYGAAWKQLLAA